MEKASESWLLGSRLELCMCSSGVGGLKSGECGELEVIEVEFLEDIGEAELEFFSGGDSEDEFRGFFGVAAGCFDGREEVFWVLGGEFGDGEFALSGELEGIVFGDDACDGDTEFEGAVVDGFEGFEGSGFGIANWGFVDDDF